MTTLEWEKLIGWRADMRKRGLEIAAPSRAKGTEMVASSAAPGRPPAAPGAHPDPSAGCRGDVVVTACAAGSRGPQHGGAHSFPHPELRRQLGATELPSTHRSDAVATDLAPCVLCCTGGSTSAGTRRSDQPGRRCRIFVAAAITGPAARIGYPTTFLVDSDRADSGTPAPIRRVSRSDRCEAGVRGDAWPRAASS